MEQHDVERIARGALTELGVTLNSLHVVQDGQPGTWKIEFGDPKPLKVKCSPGTTAQWVREQIFEQFLSR